MLSSGPPHPGLVIALYLRLPCPGSWCSLGFFFIFPPAPAVALVFFSPPLPLPLRVILFTHTPIATTPMRNALPRRRLSSPAKPISQPALLTSLGWASRRQIKANIAAMDLLILPTEPLHLLSLYRF